MVEARGGTASWSQAALHTSPLLTLTLTWPSNPHLTFLTLCPISPQFNSPAILNPIVCPFSPRFRPFSPPAPPLPSPPCGLQLPALYSYIMGTLQPGAGAGGQGGVWGGGCGWATVDEEALGSLATYHISVSPSWMAAGPS